MRGKIVNLFTGFMNILFGILVFVYTFYVPQEISELTVQELTVSKSLLKAIYVLLIIVILVNFFQYMSNRDNSKLKTGYLFCFFSLSLFFIKEPVIAIFPIVSGIITITQTLKDKSVDYDSTTAISIIGLIMIAIIILTGVAFFYKDIGKNIKNKQNANNQKYKSDYFKYVTELDISEPYINVKKDGKYGYITPKGDVVIDFKYDYASPFVRIVIYNKEFQIALVSKDKISYIILKNERQVMSYCSESSDEDYDAKYLELEDIYKNTLNQQGEMLLEVEKKLDNKLRIPVYDEVSKNYTYRYDYNDEYDLIVTNSNLGLDDTYELAKKDNLDLKFKLDCKKMDYDEKYMYLYSNKTIPFFNVSEREQGWFSSFGKKNTMKGQAQILDIIDNQILLKDYSQKNIYFINEENHERVSDFYKEIYIGKDIYIVKNNQNKYMVINKEFNKIFDDEFDIINTDLAEIGLYICCNIDKELDFNDYNYVKLNWKLLDSNGDTMLENIEQIYKSYYKNENDKKQSDEDILNSIKKLDFSFVGDKFYEIYNK